MSGYRHSEELRSKPHGQPYWSEAGRVCKRILIQDRKFLEVKERRHGQMAFPVTQEVGTTFVVL